jgi:hypothetical protein
MPNSFVQTIKELQGGDLASQAPTNLNKPLNSNWVSLIPKIINQLVINKQPIHLIALTTIPKKTLQEILRNIKIQVLETKYVINLGQLLRIVPNIKWYIFKLIKFFQLVQPEPVHLKLACATMAIDHQMATIQIQVGKNFMDDVLIDGASRVNIITKNLKI